jgi:hypothetical protein
MGCWCETCGVTQLPINHGDEVRLFVLVANGNYRMLSGGGCGGGVCYSSDLWSPLGPAIHGYYDDYGGIEDFDENQETACLTEDIRDGWMPFEAKEYESRELTDISKMGLAEMLHWIERDRAKFRPHHKEITRHLGQMMVHESVYQTMVKHDFIDAFHSESGFRYMPYSQALRNELRSWYDCALAMYKESAKGDAVSQLMTELRINMSDSRFFRFSERGDGGTKSFRERLQMQAKSLIPFEDVRVQKICTPLLELVRFNRAMTDARKLWIPQSGKGSQSNELDLYKALGATIDRHIKAREEYVAREYGDDSCERDAEGYTKWQREHNLKEDQKNGQEN